MVLARLIHDGGGFGVAGDRKLWISRRIWSLKSILRLDQSWPCPTIICCRSPFQLFNARRSPPPLMADGSFLMRRHGSLGRASARHRRPARPGNSGLVRSGPGHPPADRDETRPRGFKCSQDAVVARTFAWFGYNWRLLGKDFKTVISSSEAWLYLASIQLLARRLARPRTQVIDA